jgi:hypothetical protein
VLLLLGDGTRIQVTELPGRGPWTFVVLRPDPRIPVTSDASPEVQVPDTGPSPASDPEPGEAAGGVAGAEPLDDAWAHPGVVGAVARLLGRLGGGPGWAGIAPDAPPR